MYWVTPTLFTILLITFALAVAALTTQYAYSLTVALVALLSVGIVLGIVGLVLPSKKKTRGFRMSTGEPYIASNPDDVPPLPRINISWPKNLGV